MSNLPAVNQNQSWFKHNVIQLIQLIVVFLGIFMGGAWYLSSMSGKIDNLTGKSDEILNAFEKNQQELAKITDKLSEHKTFIEVQKVKNTQYDKIVERH